MPNTVTDDYLTTPGSYILTGSFSHRFAMSWREAVKPAGLGLQFYQPRLTGQRNLPLFIAVDRPDHVAAQLRRLLASGWRGISVQTIGPTSALVTEGHDRGATIELPAAAPQSTPDGRQRDRASEHRPKPSPHPTPHHARTLPAPEPVTLADAWPPAFLTEPGSARP